MSRIAVISTVRTPLAELRMFVHHHLEVGVDRVILYFDDPADEALPEFCGYGRVTTIACTDEYWKNRGTLRPKAIEQRQITNVNHGMTLARGSGCRWAVHIDSDELIAPVVDLKHVLDGCEADVLRFEMFEAVSERAAYPHIFAPTLFKAKPRRRQQILAKLLGCNRSFFQGQYFRGHNTSKRAFALNGKVSEAGIHGPIQANEDAVWKATRAIRLLHYDCVGFDNWRTKWSRRLDGTGYASQIRPHRAEQFRLFREAFEQGEEELLCLYERLYLIPWSEKLVLRALGLLKTITLNPATFELRTGGMRGEA